MAFLGKQKNELRGGILGHALLGPLGGFAGHLFGRKKRRKQEEQKKRFYMQLAQINMLNLLKKKKQQVIPNRATLPHVLAGNKPTPAQLKSGYIDSSGIYHAPTL